MMWFAAFLFVMGLALLVGSSGHRPALNCPPGYQSVHLYNTGDYCLAAVAPLP